MKKAFIILLSLIICLSLIGCASSDYKKATKLFEIGNYAEAQTMFETLGDYEDSAEMAVECKYQNGLRLFDQEEYDGSKEIFENLGDYKDSAEMVLECQYQKGALLIEQEDYTGAKEIFESLGDYKNSADAIKELGWMIFTDYLADEGKVIIKNKDPEYTVTLEMQGIHIAATYSISSDTGISKIRQDFVAMLSPLEPSQTVLVAEGSFSLFTAYMDDEGSALWDITTYKKGNGLKKWDDYACKGKTAQGTSVAAGTEGICYDATTPLERLTAGIKKAIKESNTGVSMSDLGFWAY